MTIVFDVDSEKATRATHVESGLSVVFLRWESGRDGLVYYQVEYDGKVMPFNAMYVGRYPHIEKLLPRDRKFNFNERNEIADRLYREGKIVVTYESEHVDPKIYQFVNKNKQTKRIFIETWHSLVSRRLNYEKKYVSFCIQILSLLIQKANLALSMRCSRYEHEPAA